MFFGYIDRIIPENSISPRRIGLAVCILSMGSPKTTMDSLCDRGRLCFSVCDHVQMAAFAFAPSKNIQNGPSYTLLRAANIEPEDS